MRLALLLGGVVLLTARDANADPPRRAKGPCAGCLTSVPADPAPAPLLVLLHGDGESADSMFDLWEPPASKRGIVVLAVSCPRDAGCASGSWWKWNGDPSWLRAQTAQVTTMHAVDPARTWIVGWSGGGTYLGWRTPEIERDYTAVVIDGGGARPALDTCAATPSAVYFLGGDRNPYHALTERLHGYYATVCPHPDLSWTVLRGADHPAERRAMATHRESILDWLGTRKRSPRGAS